MFRQHGKIDPSMTLYWSSQRGNAGEVRKEPKVAKELKMRPTLSPPRQRKLLVRLIEACDFIPSLTKNPEPPRKKKRTSND
jgi:hypothetical protein